MMLQNITECLKPGGFFIGTTPDSYDIVERIRAGGPGSTKAGNGIYSVYKPNIIISFFTC